MNHENFSMDPVLEQAVNEIRNDFVEDAVVEAAAARVWANLAASSHAPLRACADFQALIPDFKTGSLPQSRSLLVKDHLHECVACRRVYEDRVVAMPAQSAPRRANPTLRWAIAAGVVAAAGLSIWVAYDQYGNRTGHAIVQAVNGTLYEILPTGIQVLSVGQEIPDGIELRTAKDSGAMLKLKDGSVVELRERSGEEVPDDLHRRLKARAALEGLSLSDFLLQEVRHVAERPTLAELRHRLAERAPVVTRVSAARAVRAERQRQ
jgi:uncharacterized protein (DUF1778 family)